MKAEFTKLTNDLQADLIDHSNNIQQLVAVEQQIVSTVNSEVQAALANSTPYSGSTTGGTTGASSGGGTGNTTGSNPSP